MGTSTGSWRRRWRLGQGPPEARRARRRGSRREFERAFTVGYGDAPTLAAQAMLFNSPEFVLGFLPIALGGFFLAGRVGGTRWALRWIVAASLFFYGWWNPKFVLLLAGSILGNYWFGQRIDRRGSRRWLIAGIAANLALLGWFKYANFMIHDVLRLDTPELRIFLPLAISFFTFQQIMYLVESYRGERVDAGLLPYAAFVAFFPHLIAGPIVRPRDIMPQLLARDLATPRAGHIAEGLTIFLLGLAKKLVLADLFARYADVGFAAAGQGAPLSFVEAWYAAASYALQIYFDFSGYSGMGQQTPPKKPSKPTSEFLHHEA